MPESDSYGSLFWALRIYSSEFLTELGSWNPFIIQRQLNCVVVITPVTRMLVFWNLIMLFFSNGVAASASSRRAVVNIGAILSLDSANGRVAKAAIQQAINDVNSNSSILGSTKLHVDFKNSNCSAFLGLIDALKYMETDVVAIIGPQSSVVAHTVLQIADEFTTPFLSLATDPTLSPIQFPYFVRTTHSDRYQIMAVADIVYHYGWKKVTAIFVDDDYGRNGLAALEDALDRKQCRVSYKAKIPPGDPSEAQVMDVLVKVALMESRVVVLHAHHGAGAKVFSVAQYLGMLGDGYVWIATDWLSAALDSAPPPAIQAMTSNLQGVLVLRPHTPDSARKKAVRAEWKGGSLGLNAFGLYAYDTVWLLAHAIDSFLNQGGNVSLSADSQLKFFEGGKLHLEKMLIFDGGPLLVKNILKTQFVGVTGLVKFTPDGSLVSPGYEILNVIGSGLHQVGYWFNGSGISATAPETMTKKTRSRSNVLKSVVWPGESVRTPRGWVFPTDGKLLRIGVPRRAFFGEFVSQVGDTNGFRGFCIDVFVAAVNLLPYAVPYEFVPFGNGEVNPSYDALVSSISAGAFDGAVGDISIVTSRTRLVDFTQPYAESGLVVVSRVKAMNSGAWSFLRPFSLHLWAVCVAAFLFIGVVVWILEHRINDDFRGPVKRQLITIVWFSFSTMFSSHRENTVSTLGRFVLIIWLFIVLIINSSYTASLTSILTVQQLYSPIKGLESLKQCKDPIGYQVGSFVERYLMNGLGIEKSRLRALTSLHEYADALRLGPERGGVAAVVDERPYIDLFLASQCDFRIVGQEYSKSGWGFAFPRDSPLALDLSTAILTLSENGDLQRIHDKWLIKAPCSTSSDKTEIQSNRLHLTSFWGLYAIAGIVSVSAIILHVSILLYKLRRKSSNNDPSNQQQQGSSGSSKRLQTCWSLLDERDESIKKRRIEETATGTTRTESGSKSCTSEIRSENDSRETAAGTTTESGSKSCTSEIRSENNREAAAGTRTESEWKSCTSEIRSEF